MMKQFLTIIIIVVFLPLISNAQTKLYSLNECINYAIEYNTTVDRAENNKDSQSAYLEQSKAARMPNLQFGASQQISSTGNYSADNSSWNRNGVSSLNTSLSSEITLYNGAKLKNSIRQNKIDLNAAEVDIQTEKELISMDVLSAYIDVMLTKENIANSQLQLEATKEQLTFAQARNEVGTIALSDLLNIKSQLAANKTNLIQAQNSHKIALVLLMQIMNMPASDSFDVAQIKIDDILRTNIETDASVVYDVALGLQPSIKSAELNIESAEANVKIAKADALPKLSLYASVGSVYSSNYNDLDFTEQYGNRVEPSLGLNITIPIYQQKKVKTQEKIAKIQVENYELALLDQKNNLRKIIEQACTDAQLAKSNLAALNEQFTAEKEAYEVSAEMFKQDMINSVELLTAKNNYIMVENQLTQAKYTLILQKEIVEYYMGSTITL